MPSLTITIDDHILSLIDREIATGKFATPSEYISSLLFAEQLRQNHEEIDLLLLEAEDETEPPIEGVPALWAKMREELEQYILQLKLQADTPLIKYSIAPEND